MSKGKHKRKREHRQSAVQKQLLETKLLESEQQAKNSEDAQPAGQDKKEPPMSFGKRLLELWRQCSLTDRIIAFFTGVLAAASIYQFIIMGGQLKGMKLDQRPWIGTTYQWKPIAENIPLQVSVHMTNRGKTPAWHVYTESWVGILPATQEPLFTYADTDKTRMYMRSDSGTIFPHVSDEVFENEIIDAEMVNTKKPDLRDPPTLSHFDVDELNNGRSYTIIYGRTTFYDLYGTPHWTHFCNWHTFGGGDFNAKACTDYNDVDNN